MATETMDWQSKLKSEKKAVDKKALAMFTKYFTSKGYSVSENYGLSGPWIFGYDAYKKEHMTIKLVILHDPNHDVRVAVSGHRDSCTLVSEFNYHINDASNNLERRLKDLFAATNPYTEIIYPKEDNREF